MLKNYSAEWFKEISYFAFLKMKLYICEPFWKMYIFSENQWLQTGKKVPVMSETNAK